MSLEEALSLAKDKNLDLLQVSPLGADPVVWDWNIVWNESAYQADNSKGWKGTKTNLDGSDHADKDKTYDWNGSAWVEA